MKPLILSLGMALLLVFTGCNAAKRIDASYSTHEFETKCLSCSGATQTVQAWGRGKDKGHALAECRKQALRDVLFKGITLGAKSCRPQPLLPAANAQERNRNFFNQFFAPKGDWRKFAVLDEKRGCRKVAKNAEIENWQSEVTVDMDALEQYLEENNIR